MRTRSTTATITIEPRRLVVRLSTLAQPVVDQTIVLADYIIGETAFIGLTSSTGSSANEASLLYIKEWSYKFRASCAHAAVLSCSRPPVRSGRPDGFHEHGDGQRPR